MVCSGVRQEQGGDRGSGGELEQLNNSERRRKERSREDSGSAERKLGEEEEVDVEGGGELQGVRVLRTQVL